MIYMDTHSVNLSADVEEVLALFQVQLVPISAGTPQELAFAETRVKMIRRMSTAMLLGAPHLGKKFWALSDRNAVLVADFLPQSTRKNVSSYYMRTGRQIDWTQLGLKVFGAPLVFAPIDGPIHKRAAINEEGYFLGYQWPAMLVLRKSDEKVISVSRQKVRVYESAYTGPLNQRMIADNIESEFVANDMASSENTDEKSSGESTVFDGKTVQSIKSLRDHKLKLPGRNYKDGTDIEESARFGNVETFREGLYFDDVLSTPLSELAGRLEENARSGLTLKEALIKSIKETTKGVQRMALRKGKKGRDDAGISKDNILGKRRKEKRVTSAKVPKTIFDEGSTIAGPRVSESKEKYQSNSGKMSEDFLESTGSPSDTIFDEDETILLQDKMEHLSKGKYKSGKMPPKVSGSQNRQGSTSAKGERKRAKALGKHKAIAKVGDLISVPAELFDESPGSYSKSHPGKCFGTVSSISKKGIAKIIWVEDGSSHDCKLRDLTVEKRKFTSASVVAMLIEGDKVAFAPKDINDWPKDFFEVLIRSDWRKWVEAVKKEIAGWDDNRAVELVNIEDVPASAKIIPLGELYTIKRTGTYKFRQYLMGNLLRPGIDFQDNYSTTISSTGTTIFFSLAATSGKEVHGWDAVCGYLQTKEQFDIYCYLPSHEGYSNLEYEEIAELRKTFLRIHETEGLAGIKKFARNHRKQYRANPKQVYKCNSSIYGNLSAGAEFEKLMHHAHIQVCGMTQTQPEPSMFVKIKVDDNDVVIGYLIVIAFVDDVRMFGTEPELQEYKSKIASCMKVKFDELPVPEFVGIQTYQNLEKGLCELKMPNYWNKAKTFFQQFRKGDFKKRQIPLSVLDEAAIVADSTPEEIEAAKHLPYLQAVGLLSYPASQCKFEIRYAVSLVGSKRSGWTQKHFDIVIKIFEYALTTCEIGLIFSNGLDPHGVNVLYAFADANHRLPRSQSCHDLMMNGAAISMVSKKQTKSAPSTTSAETTALFQCSTDVLGVRNLMTELGMHQQYPTVIYQDNKSTIQIANNRGSLGKSSRAMDLEVLAIRNRVEDHEVATEYVNTVNQLSDMGTKALSVPTFPRMRDTMNGYALVKAHYPDLDLPDYIYEIEDGDLTVPKRGSNLERVQAMIMQYEYTLFDDDITAEDLHTSSSSEVETDFTSDHISPASDSGFSPDPGSSLYEGNEYEDDTTMQSASDVDNDDIESAESAISHQVQRLRGGADDGEEENYIEYYDYDEYNDYVRDLRPIIAQSEYQPENVYAFKLKPGVHHADAYNEELDDLPDPRLYRIDVDILHMNVLLYLHFPERVNPCSCYLYYLRHVDEKKHEFQERIDYAWASVDKPNRGPKGVIRFPVFKSVVNDHSLIVKLISAAFDPVVRSRQIKIRIESYLRRIEPHFERTLADIHSNVEWDYLTKSPAPNDSFLRWHRWRCYFLNRMHRYEDRCDLGDLSFIDDHPEGPAEWRVVDELRAEKRNWFYMDSLTIQFFKIPCGFQEDIIPIDPRSTIGDVSFWDQIPLWKLPDAFQFLPIQRIYNNKATPLDTSAAAERQFMLSVYMEQQTSYPKWGSSVKQKKQVVELDNTHGWGPAPEVQAAENDDDVEDDEERLVEIIDVSDNDGEEQDPPPPKRLRVMHESSDNRNLGT